MRRLACLMPVVLGALCAGQPAFSLEFRSVKESGVALYESPSLTASKLFVVSRYYPVEVMTAQKEWSRVRDATGGIAWIPSAALSVRRMLLVVADQCEVRRAAGESSPVAFRVPKDGVLELVEAPKEGWVHVRHRDGVEGFAPIGALWGL